MDSSSTSERAEDIVHSAPLRAVGRVGLVAYGMVHLLIAVLAGRIAFGNAEQADKSGALATIASSGPGDVLLWAVAVGLGALVVWQLAEALWGHRGHPSPRRALRVAINLVEAAIFGALAWSAAKTAVAGGRPAPERADAGLLFGLPGGRYLVAVIGVGVLGLAGYAVYRGLTAAFLRELDLRGAGLRRSLLVTRLGRVGWVALGVAYGSIGVLLVVAAVRFDPAQPVGLDAGLTALGAQPFGQFLLLVLAAGVALFGVYCLFDARYRKA